MAIPLGGGLRYVKRMKLTTAPLKCEDEVVARRSSGRMSGVLGEGLWSQRPTPRRCRRVPTIAPSSAGPTSGGNQPSALFGIGTLIGIGAGIGLIFGTMLGNIALGLGAGAALGTVTGAIVESRRNT